MWVERGLGCFSSFHARSIGDMCRIRAYLGCSRRWAGWCAHRWSRAGSRYGHHWGRSSLPWCPSSSGPPGCSSGWRRPAGTSRPSLAAHRRGGVGTPRHTHTCTVHVYTQIHIGVTELNDDLSWSRQLDAAIESAPKHLYFLRRLRTGLLQAVHRGGCLLGVRVRHTHKLTVFLRVLSMVVICLADLV